LVHEGIDTPVCICDQLDTDMPNCIFVSNVNLKSTGVSNWDHFKRVVAAYVWHAADYSTLSCPPLDKTNLLDIRSFIMSSTHTFGYWSYYYFTKENTVGGGVVSSKN